MGKIQNGFARINETFHGGRVVFVCNPNYTLVGKAGLLCRSGKWSRFPPKCYGMQLKNDNIVQAADACSTHYLIYIQTNSAFPGKVLRRVQISINLYVYSLGSE